MSNYPPPSTLRAHFNPNGHVEPPAGSYDHDPPHYPYPYEDPSFLYRQGQTNGTPMGSQTLSNTDLFRSNARGAMIPSSGNEVIGTPYTPYSGQIQLNAFQTPEYPPMPLAHSVPSYRVQIRSQPTTDSNLLPTSRTLFSDLHPTAKVQSTNIGVPETVPPVLSELEDGELDDEEVGKENGRSRTSTMTPSGVLQPKQHENVDSADHQDSESSRRAANAPIEPLPGLSQDSPATPNPPQHFTTSQPQRLPMSNGSIYNSDNTQFSRSAKNASIPRQQSTNIQNHEAKAVDQQLIDEKIEEAKQALRDLHSQGFGFDQIVKAGLNPDVLRKLYNKVESTVTASSDLVLQKVVKSGVVDVPTESVTGATQERHPNVSQKASHGDVFSNDKLPHLAGEKIRINSQPTLAPAKSELLSMESHASLAKSSKSSNVNSLGKASGSTTSGTKILDRKEYIARMLAAKAGKPTASVSTPVSSQTTTVTGTGANAQVRSLATTAPIIPATDMQAPSDRNDTALGAQKEDSDVEAKKKAQTDLARQKIEALKLRESFQQQARSATDNVISNSQQTPTRGVSSVAPKNPAPTSRSLPNRQSSYFSPASQKPPFNIPGLFMTSDALEPANLSKPPASEDNSLSSQGPGDATFGSSHEDLWHHAAASAELPTVDKTLSLPETSLDLKSALPATISTAASSSQKRQRVSDFINSPSTKVKRPLGQQEDANVIIDVSDDEVSDDSSGEEYFGRQDSLPRGPQVIVPGNGKKEPPKSLPPLTVLPQRKKSVMTPPAAQVSGQSGDLDGLKSKELEIEVMNRKIAELEQRIATKAKQTTSRSHSPRTSSRVTISPPPGGSSHQISNPPNLPLILSDSQNGDVAHGEKRESFTALAETIETAGAERLNAVEQLEQVERAKAEAERSLAAETIRALAADASLKREEKLEPQQAEEQPNFQEAKQRSEDQEQERVQAKEERRLEKSQSRQACEEETKKTRQEADHYLQEQQQTLAQKARQGFLQEQERKRTLDDQRQARKAEIESGLPLLDAEVEKTRKRLESLRQEMEILETELQKGIEGRNGLIEELRILSRSGEELPVPMDLDSCDVGEVSKQSTCTEELSAVRRPLASVETVPNMDLIQVLGTVGGDREVQGKDPSMRTTEDRILDQKFEEDIMDVSCSDVDEAEPSLYSPKAVTEAQNTPNSVNDDENYEPPTEISIFEGQERDPDVVLLSPGLETAKANLSAQTKNQAFLDPNAEPVGKQTSGERSPAPSLVTSSDKQSRRSPSHSPSPANASDPDDYEPPEPASLGNEVQRSAHMSSVDAKTSFSSRQVERNDFIAHPSSASAPAVDQQVQRLESNRTMGHFVPYESPLKQFKSFRYHPRYLDEVLGGFRSLTYSHTINPDIPLCRYEIDGVCNDDSCQSQHLRSVCLSDDKILVDLGAKPDDGSSQDEFGNGLREIIHDIRSRKVKDFNIVAGEITAYRAKFLGDRFKILPL